MDLNSHQRDYKTMPVVEVMMCVYNGERYLREQLDSIFRQDGYGCDFDLKVSVRDDGSKDKSVEILKEYPVNLITGDNVGVNAGMHLLACAADADYFAFCDQDDVWLPGKLKKALRSLTNDETPQLWACREQLTDENLNPLGLLPLPRNYGAFYSAIIQNQAPGHAQVFNRAQLNLFAEFPPENMLVYDWINYLLAATYGKVYYDEEVLGLYRQHSANGIGYDISPVKIARMRLKRLFKGNFANIAHQIRHFYEKHGDSLQPRHRRELERFLQTKGFLRRVGYALSTRVKRHTHLESLQFRLLYILGVYGK